MAYKQGGMGFRSKSNEELKRRLKTKNRKRGGPIDATLMQKWNALINRKPRRGGGE